MSKKQKKGVATCYMCNSSSTSKEHAPPKCLFPERKDLLPDQDLRKKLITVPSCDVHNTEKSHDDEYLLYVLTGSLPANETGQDHLAGKVLRAAARNPAVLKRLAKYQMPVWVKNEETGEMSQHLALKVENKRVEDSLDHASRALYFHLLGQKLTQPLIVYTNFLLNLDTEDVEGARKHNPMLNEIDQATTELLESENIASHGENPEVFQYWIYTNPLIIRLTFYGSLNATIMPPPNV